MTQVIVSHTSYKGGTNNLTIAMVVNDRLQTIKCFTGKTGIKRAEAYSRKLNA